MEGIERPLTDNSDPWVAHCNSKGREGSTIDAIPATVTLYVYGLGVWYLVDGSQRGLMNFLREESHELSIRVIEKNADGTVIEDKQVIVPMTTETLFIAGDRPQRTRIELNQRMPFDRWNWQYNDPEDMRWLVDMTNDVHGGVPVVQIPNDKVITPMTVHNALFYTKNFSDYDMDIADMEGRVLDARFGPVGCIVGAKIEADAVRIFQKGVIDRLLTKVPNYTHEIHIFNQGADVVSDFYKYYWIMQEQSPIPRQLDLIQRPGSRSVMSGEIVCASVKGDGTGPGNGGGGG
jgi:hypothetical protein